MKKYLKVDGKNQELKVQVYYSKGGMNYFTYKNEPRGYWLSVSPVDIVRRADGIMIESFTAFSGVKVMINEVKRQSDKAFSEAIKLSESKMDELIEVVKQKMS